MALFAQKSGTKISAFEANKKDGYTCLLCSGPLILKKGKSKVPHFSHKRLFSSCSLKKTSPKHMELQLKIQALFPKGEITLEKPFLEIQRIADLVWEKEKIIFELQLSSISKEEVLERERDYGSLDYEVIWLLGDKTFNQKKGKEAEIYIRKKTSYYISLKTAKIYDQLDFFHGTTRELLKERRQIFLDRPKRIKETYPLSPFLREKAQRSKIYFLNDYLFLSLKGQKLPNPIPTKANLKTGYHAFLKKILRMAYGT